MDLNPTTQNALIGDNIVTLADLLRRSMTGVVGIRNLDRKSLREIKYVMFSHKITWEMPRPR